MPFGEIVAPTKQELFIERVLSMIFSEELKPGDLLPTERELAAETKISKTVVHEGIRELARLGFLDVMSRKGVVVADYARTGNLDTLIALTKYHGDKLDPQTANSLLDLRYFVEVPLMKQLAEQHTPEDIKVLDRYCKEIEKAMDDRPELIRANIAYHHALMVLSGNTVIPLLFEAFSSVTERFWNAYIDMIGTEKLLKSIQTITRLIAEGKGQEVVDLYTREMDAYKKHYL